MNYTGLPIGHVSKMIERIKKKGNLDIQKKDGVNVYKYVYPADNEFSVLGHESTRTRAIHLIKGMGVLTIDMIKDLMCMSTINAFCIMGFLVEHGYAVMDYEGRHWQIVNSELM